MFAAIAQAPRFKILPVEALLVDNYTALHAREGYADMGRRAWRVWMWVDADCFGGPDEMRDPTKMNTRKGGTLLWA